MVEKVISTLIRNQQEIIDFLDPVIFTQEKLKTLLGDKIKEIKKHHLDCKIARGFGAGAAAVGTVLSAIPVGQPVIFGIGLGTALAGRTVCFVTDCADEVKSKTFNKNTNYFVALQNNLAGNVIEKLNDFQTFLTAIEVKRPKEMLENTGPGLSLKERFESQQSSLVKSHSDICDSISTDIDSTSLVNSFTNRFNEVKNLVNIAKMSKTLLPKVAEALQAIGAIKEIEKVIQSWKKKHPSEEAIHEILARLLESIKTLKRLRKDLDENVVLLEEKLSVITAIVTYEKIKDLINPLVSKQKKTVNWAVQEEAKLSIPHMITCNITMIMIISMFTAIVAFELGLFGEVTCGSLKIIVTCLSIAVIAAVADDLLFKHFVRALEEEMAERECSVHSLREKLIEANRLPRLRQLLETDKKTSDGFDHVFLEEAIGSTPDRPIIKASKKIGVEIHGLAMKKSSSKRLSGMQGLLIEASVILKAICILDDIGSATGSWAFRNNIQKRLVSQMPNDLINYTKSVEKLLESYKEARKAPE